MSNRAAVYARFSTDLQSERSTDDQITLCRTYADREGYQVVAAYEDKAKSGASMFGRYGLQQLLADASNQKFDVIIVEALDRLARDMEDLAGMHKRMSFLGIKIMAVHEGEANTVIVGLRGLVSQLFREDNVHKVRRGMAGRVKGGLSAGGKAYGYKPDHANKGQLKVVQEEAKVVRRVFEAYAAGTSPKEISRQLTVEGVPAPRGKVWSPSAICGWANRGTGMLRNPIYVGRIVWNKNRMVKNPDTGKRVSRPNPENEWHSVDVPELRIISNELFGAVQTRLAERAQVALDGHIGANKRPKRLLSGLLKCGACGGGMAVAGLDKSGRTRLRCSKHVNSRACPRPKTFYLDAVEELVVRSLVEELATPERIHDYATRYFQARFKEEADSQRKRTAIEHRLARIDDENMRLVNLMLQDGVDARTLGLKSKQNGEERDRLELELASLPQKNNVILHPTAIKAFADRLQKPSTDPLRQNRAVLEVMLSEMGDAGDLSPVVRELIRSITLYKADESTLTISVEGYLAPFMREDHNATVINEDTGAVMMVAEEGFEPPTQGL